VSLLASNMATSHPSPGLRTSALTVPSLRVPEGSAWEAGRVANTLHIGAAGELLVQFRLLRNGIDSARLTTDAGVDLVAYPPGTGRALTIQVKTVEQSTPAGGKGALSTGVVFPQDCPAEYLSVVRLSDERVWLFPIEDALRLSKQAMPRLYWFVDSATAPTSALTERELERYRLESMLDELRRSAR
jgi:hypothetical protein